jgi:hypothetical protein
VFEAWKAIPGIEKVLGGETGQFSLAEWMTALREGYPILDAPLKELETQVDGIKLNIVTPNHIHELAKEHSVPFSFSADHDQDASQEQTAAASDSGNARIHDAAMPEAATAEGVDPAVHDQAGPQVATSAPVIADDGFSFSAFVKQENPAEVAKAAMPTEQLSPEDIPGSGMSVDESGLPDAGDEDVGNAAPSNEHVVHHGDLAP